MHVSNRATTNTVSTMLAPATHSDGGVEQSKDHEDGNDRLSKTLFAILCSKQGINEHLEPFSHSLSRLFRIERSTAVVSCGAR